MKQKINSDACEPQMEEKKPSSPSVAKFVLTDETGCVDTNISIANCSLQAVYSHDLLSLIGEVKEDYRMIVHSYVRFSRSVKPSLRRDKNLKYPMEDQQRLCSQRGEPYEAIDLN